MTDGAQLVSVGTGGAIRYSSRPSIARMGTVIGNLTFAFLHERQGTAPPSLGASVSSNATLWSTISNIGDCSSLSGAPGVPVGAAAVPFHRGGSLGVAAVFTSQQGAMLMYLTVGST